MTKKLIIGIIIVAAFALGIALTKYYYAQTQVKVEEQSQVLLEKIKTVAKLVTVEGYFSEVYDYKDYWGYDFSLFRKKALIRVKAKVSVGYDLSNMNIKMDHASKTVILSELPDPKIISIDHDLDYYDLTEGTFNSFSAQDLTQLNEKAKSFIRQQAESSDLLITAEKQGNQMLDMIEFMVKSAGWNLKYKTRIDPSLLDTLAQ